MILHDQLEKRRLERSASENGADIRRPMISSLHHTSITPPGWVEAFLATMIQPSAFPPSGWTLFLDVCHIDIAIWIIIQDGFAYTYTYTCMYACALSWAGNAFSLQSSGIHAPAESAVAAADTVRAIGTPAPDRDDKPDRADERRRQEAIEPYTDVQVTALSSETVPCPSEFISRYTYALHCILVYLTRRTGNVEQARSTSAAGNHVRWTVTRDAVDCVNPLKNTLYECIRSSTRNSTFEKTCWTCIKRINCIASDIVF